MGTLSFAKLTSKFLATTFSSVGPSTSSMDSPKSKLSQVCLKGKLDLSMWRHGEDDDDEDMDLDSTTDIGLNPPTPPPQSSSPLLVSLLATKPKIDESNEYTENRAQAPLHLPHTFPLLSSSTSLGTTQSSSQLSPAVTTFNLEQADNNSQQGNNLRGANNTLPSALLHYYENKRELVGANNDLVGAASGNGLGTHGESQQSGLRQLGKINLGRVKPQHHFYSNLQQPTLAPILSPVSRFDSFQLLKPSQSPSGRGSVRSAGKRVEFIVDYPIAIGGEAKMESEQPILLVEGAPIEATSTILQSHPTSASEKSKRSESGKDGSSRSRSGSARRPTIRTQTDILQEIRKMSLASQDALEEKKKAAAEAAQPSGSKPRKFGRRFKNKRRKAEEEYTDKDRAAAVTLGSKDIKQSLKAKKKRDRKMRLSITYMSSEDYVIGALVGEASYQMRVKKHPEAALATLNKALEIQPNHKGALVARSQCYLKLGDAESALKDAELAWNTNNANDSEAYIQGLYQYAEALFELGEFEQALIAYHRGHRVRKDMDGFRIGIQKSQEAIRRAIGNKSATSIPNLDMVLPMIQELDAAKARLGPECKEEAVLKNIMKYKLGDKPMTDTKIKSKLITRELMGQLYLDKSYLKKFINRPEVINQQGLAKGLRDEACDALKYLEGREQFWRQQNPLYSRKNFQTMLKAHAHDAAFREKSVVTEPSIAKYLQRRSSVLATASMASTPTHHQANLNALRLQLQTPSTTGYQLKRRSSEPQLSSTGSSVINGFKQPEEKNDSAHGPISLKALKKSTSVDHGMKRNNLSMDIKKMINKT